MAHPNPTREIIPIEAGIILGALVAVVSAYFLIDSVDTMLLVVLGAAGTLVPLTLYLLRT